MRGDKIKHNTENKTGAQGWNACRCSGRHGRFLSDSGTSSPGSAYRKRKTDPSLPRHVAPRPFHSFAFCPQASWQAFGRALGQATARKLAACPKAHALTQPALSWFPARYTRETKPPPVCQALAVLSFVVLQTAAETARTPALEPSGAPKFRVMTLFPEIEKQELLFLSENCVP